MRLIDADLFVKEVAKHFTQPNYHPDADAFIAMEAEQHNNYIQGFIEDIERQPTVKIDNWIPCSEKMPKFDQNCLVTTDNEEVSTSKFYGYGEECQGYKEYPEGVWEINQCELEVIAWQSLPDKYEN